jgi:2'-5' RNA ligase
MKDVVQRKGERMSRLFVAIDLPDEVKKRIAAISGNLPGARWVPGEQLHLTLRFIGDVDVATFKAVKTALTQVSTQPFSLQLRGVGHFPPGKQPRVLWVGMEESRPLLELQERVEAALITAGIAPDERRFSPHITIARLKETPVPLVVAFEELHCAFLAGPFHGDTFHLYASTLTRDGAIHTREASYRVTGACRI